jgi:REP element-mobilizing transposase RayT
MARPVRIRVSGGWYHVFSRGHNRERIFSDPGDYAHFLEKLEEMSGLFRVKVYAYCLMPNHYHVLVSTPEANVSRAIQWLNGSYGIWYNRTHDRSGHLFGERFKAILVEDSAWGLEVSVYIHLNPVATEALGQGKRQRAAERQGLARPPSREEMARRLKTLREYRWSSYGAYAGYGKGLSWLDRSVLLKRAGKEGEASYRAYVEDRIRQGEDEGLGAKVRWGLVLGAERFAKKVRGKVRVTREHERRSEWESWIEFEQIVSMVERVKSGRWMDFRDRYGDWGRDLALWAGRRYSGLTLKALGEKVGGLDYATVASSVRRVEEKAKIDRSLRFAMKRVMQQCKKQRCVPA